MHSCATELHCFLRAVQPGLLHGLRLLDILVSHCTGLGCRMLNIEDLQNAELWQRAGLLTADKQATPEQYDSKQAATDVMQPVNADVLSY